MVVAQKQEKTLICLNMLAMNILGHTYDYLSRPAFNSLFKSRVKKKIKYWKVLYASIWASIIVLVFLHKSKHCIMYLLPQHLLWYFNLELHLTFL